jgi:protein N-terminal glutamine amidohydrolase
MKPFAYCAYYCEENAFHLCADERLGPGPRAVLFITNAHRTVVMRGQRVAGHREELAMWDYHVVVLAERATIEVWDLDTLHGVPLPLAKYLELSFPPMPARYAPSFRLVEATEFRATFATDRRHMRSSDGFAKRPPPWDPPGDGHNLDRFLDLDDPFVGKRLGLTALERLATTGLGALAQKRRRAG